MKTEADTPTLFLNGFSIHVNDFMCIQQKYVQFRYPKSKKKRIRKKWAKRPENFRFEEADQIIKWGNKIFLSENAFNLLKSEIDHEK